MPRSDDPLSCKSAPLLKIALALSACGRKAPPTAPAPDVLVTEVRPEDVAIYDDFVGTLDGSVKAASIQACMQGYLTSQNYKEGEVIALISLRGGTQPLTS